MNTLEAMKKIEEKAKELNRNEVRVVKNLPIGKAIRQGDLYVHRVADNHPIGDQLKIRQIADGFTMGARHILKGDVKVYEGKALPKYVNSRWPVGYAFRVGSEGAVLTHPEHAHIDLCDEGLYQVTHQMDIRTMQRVSD